MFACRTCQFSEPAISSCVFRNNLYNTVGETAGVTQDVGSDPTVGLPDFCTLCGQEVLCFLCAEEACSGLVGMESLNDEDLMEGVEEDSLDDGEEENSRQEEVKALHEDSANMLLPCAAATVEQAVSSLS